MARLPVQQPLQAVSSTAQQPRWNGYSMGEECKKCAQSLAESQLAPVPWISLDLDGLVFVVTPGVTSMFVAMVPAEMLQPQYFWSDHI